MRDYFEAVGKGPERPRRKAMSEGRTIRVYDYVNQPFERVRAALLADARGIFSRATTVASERAQRLASGLRVNIAGIEIGKEIDLEVLGSVDSEHHAGGPPRETRFELSWRAIGKASLFPTMTAELAIYALSPHETQLDLKGTYEPPLGPLGAVIDALVGRRIAEACMHQLIVDVAERLRSDLAHSAQAAV
jgi:hypothetical protein